MEKKLEKNEYQCALCKGVFTKGWSEEEARAEYEELFAELPGPVEQVCDDCFQQIDPRKEENKPVFRDALMESILATPED